MSELQSDNIGQYGLLDKKIEERTKKSNFILQGPLGQTHRKPTLGQKILPLTHHGEMRDHKQPHNDNIEAAEQEE